MIRFLIIFVLACLHLEAKTSVDGKIKNTSSEISSYNKNYKSINQKMSENAKSILKLKEEISEQQKHLTSLKIDLEDKENVYQENTEQLKELISNQNILKKDGDSLEQELAFTIAQSVSLSVILEAEYTASEESIIEFEVLKLMLENSKQKIKSLNDKFYNNSKNIDSLSAQVHFLEVAIAEIDAKRKDLVQTQAKNKESLDKLEIAKSSYKKELKEVLAKQDSLKRTLAELNIVKIDEINKAKEEAQRAQAFDAKDVIADDNLPNVKKHGSSYQAVTTKKYSGAKTIAPFDPYKIIKKYGTYTDPVYGIKVFNESISMQPSEKNAKVKTVLNGKIIYADKTAVLNNIVIIEHDNGLHTIYANLSQISPDIKKGIKVKKGYTIGRVSDELVFEVTQKSYHIDPEGLFE
jgi:septal ring factor EnvC (AmiA/AmiB activator)